MQGFDYSETPEAHQDSAALGGRLDDLQMDAVERVLRRAIELQSDHEHAPDTLDADAMRRIAAELGIDVHYVERALFEEELDSAAEEIGWLDRVLAPARLSGEASVVAPRNTVESTADVWMERSGRKTRPPSRRSAWDCASARARGLSAAQVT